MERPIPSVAGLGTNLKIQIIGHCIICLKRTKREYDSGGRIRKMKSNDGEEYAPREIIEGPGFLDTFNVIWDFLQKKHSAESNGCREGETIYASGIALETVMQGMTEEEDGSGNINCTFTDAPPTICLQCCEKVVAVQDMMKVLKYQIQEIEVLVKESRGLQVYTLEVENHLKKKADVKCGRSTENKVEREGCEAGSKQPEVEAGGDDDDDDTYYGFNMQLNPETGEWEEPKPSSSGSHPNKKLSKPSTSKSISYSSDQSDHGDNYGAGDDDRMSDDQDDYQNPQTSNDNDGNGNQGNKPQTSKILRGKRIKWQELKITDEELERDWRRRCLYKQNYGMYQDYYCAYGKNCQRKVKKKILTNGVSIITTNGLEHSNHRRIHFGLTDEQKEFIVKCVKEGVTQPNNILLSFYAQNVKAPEKLQVCNWLARNRRNRTFENL